ncbi:MAG: hypothetical protein WA867_08270 [Candidatus Acidiferrales bacterium]
MKLSAIALLCCLLLPHGPRDDLNQGTICVAPISAERPTRFLVDYNPATLALRIDKRKAIPWPHVEGTRIEGLDPKQRQLVVITSDGKSIQSFWFRFADYKSERVCLGFDGFPAELQAGGASWCKCK